MTAIHAEIPAIETMSSLRIAYYTTAATLWARGFEFVPAFKRVERDYRVLVERAAARRHGGGRFVARYGVVS